MTDVTNHHVDPFVEVEGLPRAPLVEQVVITAKLPMGVQGPTGPTGPEGVPGTKWMIGYGPPTQDDGAASQPGDLYLDNVTGQVYRWQMGGWGEVGNLRGPIGPTGPTGTTGDTGIQGPTGPKGDTGGAIWIKGNVDGPADLPPTGALGDGYIQNDNGHLWVWTGTEWIDVGEVRGPTGLIDTLTVPFAPVGATGAAFLTQTIDHTLQNVRPTVRVLFDTPSGLAHDDNATVGVTYTANNQVVISLLATMATGKSGSVVLQ